MGNHWLNHDREVFNTNNLCHDETPSIGVFENPAPEFSFAVVEPPMSLAACFNINPDPTIGFYVLDKKVMWIDKDGKIHVDPDAPANETAQKVCEIMSQIFTLGR
jgi:hypothetical protein